MLVPSLLPSCVCVCEVGGGGGCSSCWIRKWGVADIHYVICERNLVALVACNVKFQV